MSPDRRQNHGNFFLACRTLPRDFGLCRPVLEQVYKDEKHELPPPDIFSLFKLSGFGVKDPRENLVQWDVSFEAKGDDYFSEHGRKDSPLVSCATISGTATAP